MIKIVFKNGCIAKWKKKEWSDYKYDGKCFIVIKNEDWVGFYNIDSIASVIIKKKEKIVMIKDLKVTKGTVVRTVMTVAVILNLVLKAFWGIRAINIDQNDVSAIIENLVSIGVIILGFWKNNSFTDKAKAADFYLAKLRNFDTDEADSIFDEKE